MGVVSTLKNAGGDFKDAIKTASSSVPGKIVRGVLMPGAFLPAAVLMGAMAVVLKGMDICWSTIHKTKFGSELIYDPFFHNASATAINAVKGLFWFTAEPYIDFFEGVSYRLGIVGGLEGGQKSQGYSRLNNPSSVLNKPDETASKDAQKVFEEVEEQEKKPKSKLGTAAKIGLAALSPVLLPVAAVAAVGVMAADKLTAGFAKDRGKYQVVGEDGKKVKDVSGEELYNLLKESDQSYSNPASDLSQELVSVSKDPQSKTSSPRNCGSLQERLAGLFK